MIRIIVQDTENGFTVSYSLTDDQVLSDTKVVEQVYNNCVDKIKNMRSSGYTKKTLLEMYNIANGFTKTINKSGINVKAKTKYGATKQG